jgi:hypothetical protein
MMPTAFPLVEPVRSDNGVARHGPPHVGTMIWTNRAALGAGGRNSTDWVIHTRDRRAASSRTMSTIPPTRPSSPAAQRMRLYRERRRQRLRYIPIPLHETDIDALIRMRLLKEDQRCKRLSMRLWKKAY